MNKCKTRKCPACGKKYFGYPALSRKDNKTEICSTCGMVEALQALANYRSKKDVRVQEGR